MGQESKKLYVQRKNFFAEKLLHESKIKIKSLHAETDFFLENL